MGDDSQTSENHHAVLLGQLADETVCRRVHASTRSLTLQAIYQSSETEIGFASHGSLLSLICPIGGRGPRAAMYLRRATRAAKSSCKRRIEG